MSNTDKNVSPRKSFRLSKRPNRFLTQLIKFGFCIKLTRFSWTFKTYSAWNLNELTLSPNFTIDLQCQVLCLFRWSHLPLILKQSKCIYCLIITQDFQRRTKRLNFDWKSSSFIREKKQHKIINLNDFSLDTFLSLFTLQQIRQN